MFDVITLSAAVGVLCVLLVVHARAVRAAYMRGYVDGLHAHLITARHGLRPLREEDVS